MGAALDNEKKLNGKVAIVTWWLRPPKLKVNN
jgi:hypothetical protein